MRAASLALACGFALLSLLSAAPARGQAPGEGGGDLSDRPLSSIRVVGASEEDERLIRNNIRAAVGDPYDPALVRDDVNWIYTLGRHKFVTAEAELAPDGSVAVIYSVTRQPVIGEVQVLGNSAISDQELLDIVRIVRGFARDDYTIERAKRRIEEFYRGKGYYLTVVSIDESELEARGILIFRIVEGPRVRIKVVEFRGASAFAPKLLMAQIRTRPHVPLVRSGIVDEDVLAADVGELDRYYKGRGYLDVRVDREVELSPDNTEAKVVFHIDEGRQYRLGRVRVQNDSGEPTQVYSPEQIAAMLEIKVGDVYSQDKLRTSLEAVEEAYEVLGYLDEEDPNRAGGIRVDASELRGGAEPIVELLLTIHEGRRTRVGLVRIDGNFLTKDKVIRRLLTVSPGRPYDAAALEEAERRIRRTRLFNDVRITIQEPSPRDPAERDLLVEVKERNTGSLNFGVAVGSDSGLFGEISLNQQNFDIADVPRSWSELVSGRAFRGAGQRFNMTLRPGNELFQYLVSLTEPHLFESDYALTVAGFWRDRDFDDYDEERLRGSLRLSRAIGDFWQVEVNSRAERVELTEIELNAPTEIFADMGPDAITGLGIGLTRTTVGSFDRPGRGSRLELSLERAGALGGDIDFWNASVECTTFFTLDEDFLGRKSILRLNARAAYIFGEEGRVPTYERYYLGGRSFRGFDFRTVSPKGIGNVTGEPVDDPIGGEWLFFAGAQYEFPLFQEAITGVLFLDTGTVTRDPGFDDYRVSIGAGVRLRVPQLGPAPIAFDFGVPILKQDGDEEQVLSFSAELPF